MYFKKYNHCIFCGSKKLIKEKKQTFRMNFYLKAIMSDLDLSKKDFKKINVYRYIGAFPLSYSASGCGVPSPSFTLTQLPTGGFGRVAFGR